METNLLPVFLAKLVDILDNSQNNHIISWGTGGYGFVILEEHLFEKVILPKYYKHSNINSFIRQLNMYHFVKTKINGLKNEFYNEHFCLYQKHLLNKIKRKPEKKKAKTGSTQEVLSTRPINIIQNFEFNPADIARYLQSIQQLRMMRSAHSEFENTTEQKVSIDNDISNMSPAWKKEHLDANCRGVLLATGSASSCS